MELKIRVGVGDGGVGVGVGIDCAHDPREGLRVDCLCEAVAQPQRVGHLDRRRDPLAARLGTGRGRP